MKFGKQIGRFGPFFTGGGIFFSRGFEVSFFIWKRRQWVPHFPANPSCGIPKQKVKNPTGWWGLFILYLGALEKKKETCEAKVIFQFCKKKKKIRFGL